MTVPVMIYGVALAFLVAAAARARSRDHNHNITTISSLNYSEVHVF
jgi:uncharacterized membrane protein YhhN